MKYKTKGEQTEFWRKHWESVKSHHEEMVKLPYEEKLAIVEELQADYRVIRESLSSLKLSKT